MYNRGDGVLQSRDKTIEWFKKAADVGCSQAMLNLGSIYFDGIDVPQDYPLALEWYTKAADAGNGTAM